MREAIPPPLETRLDSCPPFFNASPAIVAEVFGHAGKNLNLALVEAGQAAVYPRYCRDSPYFDAQAQAKADRRGIWGEGRRTSDSVDIAAGPTVR
ncbi:MAG: thermonuclease family protein [Chromatiales bacterium]|nr:thermonuclease family protein [Chromatiales bacterium]